MFIQTKEYEVDKTLFEITPKKIRTRKNPIPHYKDFSTGTVLSEREVYASQFLDLASKGQTENVFYFDENTVVLNQERKSGKASVRKTGSGDEKYSLFCVVSRKKILRYNLTKGTHSLSRFITFFQEFVEYLSTKNKANPLLVLSKTEITTSPQVYRIIQKSNIRLIYLPYSSPYLNPAESAIKKWREAISFCQAKDENDFLKFVSTTRKNVTEFDLEGYYRKTLSTLESYLKNNSSSLYDFFS